MVLEICVDSVDSARAAQSGGAQRVELCSNLCEGGVTPSSGQIEMVREAVTIPVFVMVRPRSGDFFYSSDEFAVMKRDVLQARQLGANGVVLGVLFGYGEVDVARTRELVDLARPMEVTFHRAFDWVPRMEQALDSVIETGADRILTSGGTQTAEEGRAAIAKTIALADGRVRVMVCGKVREHNIGAIARDTGATEFHASLRKKARSPVTYERPGLSMGDSGRDEFIRYTLAADDVRALREEMSAGR